MGENNGVSTPHNQRDLADLVRRTIVALDNARLPLALPGTEQLNESRLRLRTQLAARIQPHLVAGELPTVVVLGGSSGAGKSTIVNSLLGEEVSPASVLRPTTRTPVIAMHPLDEETMEGHALRDMGRVVVSAQALPGLVLVDAPDLDSVDADNRELSRRLLDAADLWLFVTTASRYGDAPAWRMLLDAHTRGMTTAVVLNRVRLDALYAIRHDLMKRLDEHGMGEDPLLIVPDAGPREGLLDPNDIAEIRDWLRVIASTRVGKAITERTNRAMLPELRAQLIELGEAVEMQANTVQDLVDRAREASYPSHAKLATNATNGRFGQGAPTTAWLSFASSGAVLAVLAAGEKPGWRARKTVARDEAAHAVFSGVLGAVRVGLQQGLATSREAIETAWAELPVDLSRYVEQARVNIDEAGALARALDGWRQDLRESSARVSVGHGNPWFDAEGTADLIGAAAGGVAGAVKALDTLGLAHHLRPAREALVARLETAIAEITECYTNTIESIDVGNGRELRLRASEYLERV